VRQRPRLDDIALEIRAASFDLLGHLALLRARRFVLELRYRADQPRAPHGVPEGGQWVRDAAHLAADPVHVAAVRPRPITPRCDGFSSGCQNGGSFGTSGMFVIGSRKLCWDCAIKWFGLEDDTRKEQMRILGKFNNLSGD
jgi:hypothetical protein